MHSIKENLNAGGTDDSVPGRGGAGGLLDPSRRHAKACPCHNAATNSARLTNHDGTNSDRWYLVQCPLMFRDTDVKLSVTLHNPT